LTTGQSSAGVKLTFFAVFTDADTITDRFIGDASALWKRDKQEDSSQCECEVEDGCGEACHNRIMAYECDFWNCRLSADTCRNRPFAELKRRSKGNRYDYGVEVMETDGRGYGVRAMRTFQPHQIIVEYAGEIITQSECERRMKQVYKKDKVCLIRLICLP
jgi:palmitoyltransferase ZDHHC9/14/18